MRVYTLIGREEHSRLMRVYTLIGREEHSRLMRVYTLIGREEHSRLMRVYTLIGREEHSRLMRVYTLIGREEHSRLMRVYTLIGREEHSRLMRVYTLIGREEHSRLMRVYTLNSREKTSRPLRVYTLISRECSSFMRGRNHQSIGEPGARTHCIKTYSFLNRSWQTLDRGPSSGGEDCSIGWPRRLSGGPVQVLGIECSCDDSCASIVGSDKRILSNVRLSQNDVHKAFNGIHSYHAIHAHQINVPIAIGRALKEAGLKLTELNGIAYTRGPGIAGCLAVGATR
ncbi:hypothetical protein PGT21_012461 [Puccinia graminis f. sp. tritici]|uniref:N(6)-L-threonylcarbamoyladenine synthase n=1 Tax=Puccinia graminis f. sp. tritici TaxID=56615 RepID=A0A5B0R0D0_PUCGR|nr:hypothetical protein PGT21_012461 [Puccinia graminis f. sp. tritici]